MNLLRQQLESYVAQGNLIGGPVRQALDNPDTTDEALLAAVINDLDYIRGSSCASPRMVKFLSTFDYLTTA